MKQSERIIIIYLTTMDFLCRALSSGKMSLAQCNDFIKRVKEVRGKLPVNKMEDFKCRQIDFNS